MNDAPTVSLPRRQMFELPDASTARILCTAGCLWLTLDDDPRDVILEPGKSFETTQARRALVYAIEPSAFLLGPRLGQVAPARGVLGRAPLLFHRPRARLAP